MLRSGSVAAVAATALSCVPGRVGNLIFNQALGLAVDAEENVFVADSFGGSLGGPGRVVKCSSGGSVDALEWSCQNFAKPLDFPTGVAVTSNGIVYISWGDDHNVQGSKVKKCTAAGDCSDFGEGWDSPRGLDVDGAGNLYVANAYGYKRYGVWKCTSEGSCTAVGDSQTWPHYPPEYVAVDSRGTVYVAGGDEDSGDQSYLKKCSSDGSCVDVPGAWGRGAAVAVDAADNIYIANEKLHRCSASGDCAEITVEGPKQFEDGAGIAIGAEGAVYRSQGPLYRSEVYRYCIVAEHPIEV